MIHSNFFTNTCKRLHFFSADIRSLPMKKITKITIIAAAILLATNTYSAEPVNNDDWLHVDGNQIVDIEGKKVWLTGANWFGFNAGERTFHGLWSVNLDSTVQAIAERGINILRVPISTELLYEWSQGSTTLPNVNTSTNPELVDKTDLEIFDIFLAIAKKYGIKVLLDVHSAEADNSGHVYRMWYKGEMTSEIFYQSWEWVTARYQNDDTILAMDIENEPHGKPWTDTDFAKWDNSTDVNNWKYACETASKRILDINPNMLVLCEGIESFPADGINWISKDKNEYLNNWWGGNLQGVKDYPIDLGEHQDQLVYSPHDYGPLVYKQPWFYEGFNKDTLYNDVWKDNWMFIHEEGIAPLLLGEWGGFMDGGDNEKWMIAIRDLIIEHGLHHTFWCINPNSGDTGGLLNNDWKTWDEEKYALFEPSLWKTDNGKFIGLDHQVVLGNATVGTNVTEYYNSLAPFVTINTPAEGSNVLTGQTFELSFKTNKLTGVNVYLDGKLVTATTDEQVTLTAPTVEKTFTVKLVGNVANGDEIATLASLNLNAVEVLPAEISILSPADGSKIEQSKDFSLEISLKNAAGYTAVFNGQSQTVTSGGDVSFTAPEQVGVYPVNVTAIDVNSQPVAVTDTIDIEVIDRTVHCKAGNENVWNTGFVINDVSITNTGGNAAPWSVELHFDTDITFVNGWNGTFNQIDSKTLSITAFQNLAAGQRHNFGFQANHSGTFSSPNCVVK